MVPDDPNAIWGLSLESFLHFARRRLLRGRFQILMGTADSEVKGKIDYKL